MNPVFDALQDLRNDLLGSLQSSPALEKLDALEEKIVVEKQRVEKILARNEALQEFQARKIMELENYHKQNARMV